MIRSGLRLGVAAAALMSAPAAWAGGGEAAGDTARLAGQCLSTGAAPCPADYPPRAEPGQCYAKIRTPPRFETYSETVVVTPARREARTIPAVYETADQQVMISPERVERYTVPATYRTVYETVVERPAGVRTQYEEAVYQARYETVMVRPARTEWRRQFVGPGGIIPVGARIQPTGEILCLMEIPAEFQQVERRVLIQPARSYQVVIPAVMRQVARQVVDCPDKVMERVIPAVWRTEQVRRVVEPARTEYVDIPAVTRTEARQRQIDAGEEAWQRIDCAPEHAPAPPPPLAGERPGPPPRFDGERG